MSDRKFLLAEEVNDAITYIDGLRRQKYNLR